MNDWFESLEQREKILVSVGAVVVIITVLYAFAWLPIDKGHKELSASVDRWQRSLSELQPLKHQKPATATSRPAAAANQTPVVIVDQTLRARGLDRALQRSQPTTSTGIRVEFENVAFDDLVLWLGDLNAQYAMDVTTGTFSKPNRAEPGRINANLTLERTL